LKSSQIYFTIWLAVTQCFQVRTGCTEALHLIKKHPVMWSQPLGMLVT